MEIDGAAFTVTTGTLTAGSVDLAGFTITAATQNGGAAWNGVDDLATFCSNTAATGCTSLTVGLRKLLKIQFGLVRSAILHPHCTSGASRKFKLPYKFLFAKFIDHGERIFELGAFFLDSNRLHFCSCISILIFERNVAFSRFE